MADYELLIRGGTIIDGSRAPRFIGDVGIVDGRVVSVGHLAGATAKQEIDATGCIVAPGSVDLHTHYDAQIFWDPYCTISGWHGVTSVVVGNCGLGFAPVAPELRERTMLSMSRVEAIPLAAMRAGLPWDWVSFPEFLDSLDRTPKAVNVLALAPTGPMLIDVLGFQDAKAGRMPTDKEHRQLQALLDEAIEAGACGWSAQRLVPTGPASNHRDFDGSPMVTDVMHDETCVAFAEVLGKWNRGFMQLTMVSGEPKRDAAHLEELAIVSGRPVLYNVVIAFDDRPNVHRGALKWLDSCRERGIRMYGQGQTTDAGFTFTLEDWNMFDDSDSWREATIGTIAEKLDKLADPGRREALKTYVPMNTEPIERITILGPKSPETEQYRELTVQEAADRMGKHPIDAFLDIAVADGLRTLFFANPTNTSFEHLKEIVSNPSVLLGVSDGGAHTKFLTSGRYPTDTIARLVREEGICDLEEAHWRLAALPAACAGLRDRGVIREGAWADIIVYDFDRLRMLPTEVAEDLPGGEWRRVQRAEGYRWVVVNGVPTIKDDELLHKEYPGRLLRGGCEAR